MAKSSDEVVVVYITCPEGKSEELARVLVGEQLAACANIIPTIRSIYRWNGALCDDAEALLLVKTRASRFAALEERVRAAHPYEVPEIIAVPVALGHAPYLQWVCDSTSPVD